MKAITIIIALFIAGVATGSQVSIVDSGTFFDHDKLKGRAWINSGERADNNVDDDRNGKVDDVVGWNFAEKYSEVFFPDHLEELHPIIYVAFRIIAKIQKGNVTPEEVEFWNTNIIGIPEAKKKKLFAQLNFYGQYAHGTHCSGVVALGNKSAKIMSARVFPDAMPGGPHEPFGTINAPEGIIYKALAKQANIMFSNVADYLKETDMRVANYSLGTPLPMLAVRFMKMRGIKNPTPAQIKKETDELFEAFGPEGKKWINKAPNTLFVIAAGNDNTDNDYLPYFPANVKMKNAMTVAASDDYIKIAKFSNYGKINVDVAAPGVAINSTVPGPESDMMLPMSGTSMAAPFVTMVASKVSDINPKLTAEEIKEIVIRTVDIKSWLREKVASSGIVNPGRAYKAASLSLKTNLKRAIRKSRSYVRDVRSSRRPIIKGVPPTPEMVEWADKLVF